MYNITIVKDVLDTIFGKKQQQKHTYISAYFMILWLYNTYAGKTEENNLLVNSGTFIQCFLYV